MKISKSIKYSKYVYEYIRYGLEIGLFDIRNINDIKNKLLNIDIENDNTTQGEAKVVGYNLLLINESRLINEKITSLVLFHEFTHVLSSIYGYVYEKDSILYKFKNKYSTSYFGNHIEWNNYNINLSTYYDCGLVLLDEVLAESIATMLVNEKYNMIFSMRKSRYFGNHSINYECSFDYYGFEEHMINLFAKTLDLDSNDNDIFGLCKKLYDKNFVKDIIYQFSSQKKGKTLYNIICYFGIFYDYEEYRNGRLLNKLPDKFIYNIYKKLIKILNENIKEINKDKIYKHKTIK